MYYIYLLRCADQSLYTGITTDVKRRFQEHQGSTKKGAKYTHTHIPIEIVAVWSCDNRSQASKLEYWMKTLTKKQKENIIKSNSCLPELLGDKIDCHVYHRLEKMI